GHEIRIIRDHFWFTTGQNAALGTASTGAMRRFTVDGNGTAASVASTQTGLRRKNGHGILKEWTEYEFQ
ncbi:MAG: hypothetical protein ACLR07_18350, partial [Christensenellales bacterium]